ncbi:MAG: hypothetical protein M4D80_14430 [Myxococcota bacterium]|nr:hypothetical protein [Deltaproteobacteria bacterium]MDQ3336362.1 hypothetical protein [Myxococcota bacterium]
MRFLFVAVAGAIGWLWFAARAPADAPPPPSPQVRRADLTGLGAQVTAARRSAEIPAIEREVETDEETGEPDADAPELADVPEPELTELEDAEPDWADLAEQAQLAVYDRPPPADAIDLSEQIDHQELIQIEGSAPIIDTTSTRHCGVGVEIEYTKNIPLPGRTFENAVGAAIIDGEVVISSGTPIENEYVVEDQPAIDQPAIDLPD